VSPEYFAEIIRQNLPEPHASLMNGIVLGIPLKNQWGLYQGLIRVGLVHMVVLSGMNITLLVQLISSTLFFVSKQLRIVITILAIVGFTFFVGIQPPIARAAVMGVISLLGLQLGRRVSSWYCLMLSGIICLLIWPEWVSSLSFYLSYAATSGIVLVPKPFSATANRKKPLSYIYKYCLEDLQTSLSAQIFTLPLIWYFFGRISLVSPLTNLLVSWTIAPIMVLGFIICALGQFSSHLVKPAAFISYVLISYIITIVHLFS
jgi:competence protein ComEC